MGKSYFQLGLAAAVIAAGGCRGAARRQPLVTRAAAPTASAPGPAGPCAYNAGLAYPADFVDLPGGAGAAVVDPGSSTLLLVGGR